MTKKAAKTPAKDYSVRGARRRRAARGAHARATDSHRFRSRLLHSRAGAQALTAAQAKAHTIDGLATIYKTTHAGIKVRRPRAPAAAANTTENARVVF
jgi:hypothetical protein